MKRRFVVGWVVAAAVLPACSKTDEGPKNQMVPVAGQAQNVDPIVDQTTVESVIHGFFSAVSKHDGKTAYALMTEECRKKEQQHGSFTYALLHGVNVKTYRIESQEKKGNGIRVHIFGTLVFQGEEDDEGMDFELVQKDGKWWLTYVSG